MRELKARLSHYVSIVKRGGVVTVTERGTPVARLVPVSPDDRHPSLEERIAEAVRAGEFSWSGRKLRPARPQVTLSGEGTLADLIIEERQRHDDELYRSAFGDEPGDEQR